MPTYIVLSRLTAEGRRSLRERFKHGSAISAEVQSGDGKVIEQFALIGEYDFCSVVSLPNNAAAQMLGAAHLGMRGVERTVLPAIDLGLFIRLMGQTTETVGPHRWQISWHCRLFRRMMRPYLHATLARRYFRPFVIEGRDRLRQLRGPVIFIANHASHLDMAALIHAIPPRYRGHTYFGSAADRWFLKGRKELRKQGWWRSLAYASFPIQRGGGSRTLDYAEWLIGRGGSIGIFPEGTRTTTGKLGKFRHGVSILALKTEIPVVPIYMDGLRTLLPKGGRDSQAGPVHVLIGAPVRFVPGTEVSEATRKLYRTVEELRRECRSRRKGEPAAPMRPAA